MAEEKNILWHTCRSQNLLYREEDFKSGPEYRYFAVDDKFRDFRLLPNPCKCRKKITMSEAEHFVACGKAQYLCRRKSGRVWLLNNADSDSKCHAVVAHVERGQTPRVDMITAADVQRAVIGSERKILAFVYNPKLRRWQSTLPSNPTEEQKKAWFALLDLENTHERRIRKQYEEYIALSWQLAMETRSLLFRGIVLEEGKKVGGQPEFLDVEADQRGRPLFWCDDERTK
jgi:hypothetical protein